MPQVICPVCGKVFGTRNQYYTHYNKEHTIKPKELPPEIRGKTEYTYSQRDYKEARHQEEKEMEKFLLQRVNVIEKRLSERYGNVSDIPWDVLEKNIASDISIVVSRKLGRKVTREEVLEFLRNPYRETSKEALPPFIAAIEPIHKALNVIRKEREFLGKEKPLTIPEETLTKQDIKIATEAERKIQEVNEFLKTGRLPSKDEFSKYSETVKKERKKFFEEKQKGKLVPLVGEILKGGRTADIPPVNIPKSSLFARLASRFRAGKKLETAKQTSKPLPTSEDIENIKKLGEIKASEETLGKEIEEFREASQELMGEMPSEKITKKDIENVREAEKTLEKVSEETKKPFEQQWKKPLEEEEKETQEEKKQMYEKVWKKRRQE